MTNEEEFEASWSIPKIIAGVIILGVLGWFIYQNRSVILSINDSPRRDVAGASIHTQNNAEKIALPKFDLQQKIQDITAEVSNLNVKDVAGSSPQVQKVLRDMQSLKDLPKSQAKDACMKICSGL